MEYVAILRARRLLTWYGGVVLAMLLLMLYGTLTHHGTVRVDHGSVHIPLSALVAGSAVGAVVIAAFLASAFDNEYKTAAIAFTRPMTRLSIATRFAAVAAVAMAAAAVITFVAVFVTFAASGLLRYVAPDGSTLPWLALVLGVAAMWYGLVVLAAAIVPGRAGAIVGLSWAYALIVPALAHAGLPGVFHAIFGALQFLDPLAYVGSIGNAAHQNASVLGIESVGLRSAITWAIGLAALASGVTIWAKREVPA